MIPAGGVADALSAMFAVSAAGLLLATVLLLTLGGRVRVASRVLGIVLGAGLSLSAGAVARFVWAPPAGLVRGAEVVLAVVIAATAFARPRWNPLAQAFAGAALASSALYLVFGATITVAGGLSVLGIVASALLLVLEATALALAGSFAVESLESVCAVHAERPRPTYDASYVPMVSLHIAAYNEPPDMLIEVIRTAEAIDYPRFEIVVIDNNTPDPAVWRPVEEYCRDRPLVTYVHVDPWPGYKSGALNLALQRYTSPEAELVGVIDADYLVDPSYLRELVGYFADPAIAFLQTPQDYREFEHDAYLTACYDAYRYFFLATMPVRDRRNSIIFAGTMGLLRREILQRLGGWSEWCITEDAEASLRILREGYEGLFVPRSYGRGIMPLTFASLKSQRFRWCFGGMQILRMHRRSLMPWNRDPANGLSTAQRLDYLLGGLQWLNDLVLLGFSVVLLSIAAVFLVHGTFPLRPLLGAAAVLPVALIASGLLRALWALRERARIGTRRAVLAFANWLSLSWTVALACLNGLIRREGVFLRTPKQSERPSVMAAVWAARTETALACVLWAAGAALVITRHAGPLLVLLFAWQGAVYATAPFMAWMNQHTELSAQLERRRRSEYLRERAARVAPAAALVSGVGVLTGGVIAVAIVLAGTTSPPTTDPATRAGSGSGSPAQTSTASGGPSAGTVTPSADATVTPSSGPSSPSASQTPSPTSTPSPTGSPSPSSTPSATSTPSPTTSPSPTATPSATTSGGASVSPSATAGPGP